MTNYEKHKKWLDEHEFEFKYCGDSIALKSDSEICLCSEIKCGDCIFERSHEACKKLRYEWLKAEAAAEEEEEVDWTKVSVDTKVEVKDSTGALHVRYFAAYIGGKVYTFDNGLKSNEARAMTSYEHVMIIG